jgi:hypothetical protein
MKQLRYYLLPVLLMTCFNLAAQTNQNKEGIEQALLPAKKWFSAWELLCKEVYKINNLKPVDFLFFDEVNIYTTSTISGRDGLPINGPQLLGTQMQWLKKAHEGTIRFPNGQEAGLGLMSFAMPLEHSSVHSIFIMPLPGFWKMQKVESKELGIENLITGVFLHEFAHSQQMQNFGKKISEYESGFTDTLQFSDDLIQDYFEKDSVYTKLFRAETENFYVAAAAKNKSALKQKTMFAITQLKERHRQYFIGNKTSLAEIDAFFLTMEGVGQYSMYAWLIHPKGGNIAPEIALKGVRRNGKWWSQEEGLATILLLCKFYKPAVWAKIMFGNSTESSIELIAQKMKERK